MKFVILGIILLYQKTLSPDHGWNRQLYPHGFCHFYPTCSEYTYQAVERFGVLKGLVLGFRRIVRCNPWTSPAVDPLTSEAK